MNDALSGTDNHVPCECRMPTPAQFVFGFVYSCLFFSITCHHHCAVHCESLVKMVPGQCITFFFNPKKGQVPRYLLPSEKDI